MASRAAILFRELGIPVHETGIASPHSFVHAVYAAERGLHVFQSCGGTWSTEQIARATSDVEEIRALYERDRSTDWRVVAGRDFGVFILQFPRRRDMEHTMASLGPLLTSWRSRRGEATFCWAKALATDPELATGKQICGTRATLCATAALPGSVNPDDGTKFTWERNMGMGEVDLSPLPLAYLSALPYVGSDRTAKIAISGITARPLRKPTEFKARGRLKGL